MSRLNDIADALEAERYRRTVREVKLPAASRAYLDLLAIAQADDDAVVHQLPEVAGG